MTATLENVLKTLEGRREQSLAQLVEFLKIPSISAKPDYKGEVARCAQWLADQFKFAELETSVMQTKGHPVVVAKNKHIAGRPTVLLYGHYDVQPPEPLDLWTTPAFEPTVRKDDNGFDAIYARGAVDDKGQVWAHVEAITAWQANGGLPVNLIALIEGEEEVGSPNLEPFIRYYADQLKADICLISDTGMYDRDTPAITYSLRGLVYAEIEVTGPSHDLHSGGYGGAAPNPANALCKIIASMHDADGRVTIPGFYNDVQPLSDHERELWKRFTFSEADWCRDIGIASAFGPKEWSVLEKLWAQPTLDVNGITAGYQGAGAKTVIASKASAKVSMRLVPSQDPKKIAAAFEAAVRKALPSNCKLDFHLHGMPSAAVITPIDSPAAELAAEAIEKSFNTKPVFIRGGGSIPVVADLKKVLGVDTLLIGFGLDDDRVHSPNEKMDLGCFYNAIKTSAALYESLAKLK